MKDLIDIIWSRHKLQSLFYNKDKVQYSRWVIYKSVVCSCDTDYIENIRNVKMR